MAWRGNRDSFACWRMLDGTGLRYPSIEAAGIAGTGRLPVSLRILLENLLRFEDGRGCTAAHARLFGDWVAGGGHVDGEIPFRPARVLLHDTNGVPALADLAAMRDRAAELTGDPGLVNPTVPTDLVIDHSVNVDVYGRADAFRRNVEIEYSRNAERYAFMRWGQAAFDNFRVVPPGTGIMHQVNVEYLSTAVRTDGAGDDAIVFPDTLLGSDSHTTMVNGLGVLGWGVGGIEAEAAMLGRAIPMKLPDVVGFRLDGALPPGATATDLVLTVTQMLRAHGVVGKFVEFYGDGLDRLSLPDRATIANMAPEYGATMGFFPFDRQAADYMRFCGRDEETVTLAETYARAQGLWRETGAPAPLFTETLTLDLATVVPCLAGPRRPQDKVPLDGAAAAFATALADTFAADPDAMAPAEGMPRPLRQGDVVIAAITSCTNTSNPSVMLAAGLLARNARARGLAPKPWVKTSLAPGSQVVTDYLEKAGLQDDLDALGFGLVGYGCTTCIGNSGPLDEQVADAVEAGDLVACAVLSGNRNFEGRIHPQVRANYLASPPLVVAYALAGSMRIDLARDPLGDDADGDPVYLKDIWPGDDEIAALARDCIAPEMFQRRYADVFAGDAAWRAMPTPDGAQFTWEDASTYLRRPPYFDGLTADVPPVADIAGARVLLSLGDSITTDHISPAGAIREGTPPADWLQERQVRRSDFNTMPTRRGNHAVMVRAAFSNPRLRNELAPGTEGGMATHQPSGDVQSVFEVAERYRAEGVPLVVVAGRDYGTGSSRDWAAKGTALLGVKAVIAESFERIHRSNLVGMGVLPLQLPADIRRADLAIDGTETLEITGLADGLVPGGMVTGRIRRADGSRTDLTLACRIDTADEADYLRHGGILPFVLRELIA